MVMEVVHEDMVEDNMQCTNHPYKNSTPGGICAFCLQEKLGKLVSSSYPVAIFPSSSSSPSPSLRSAYGGGGSASAVGATPQGGSSDCNNHGYYHTRRARLPFVLAHKKKKKKDEDCKNIVFKRSKSIATPRRRNHFLDESEDNYSPNRRGFWSFFYLSKSSTFSKKSSKDLNFTSSTTPSTVGSSSGGAVRPSRDRKRLDFVVVDENGSPDEATLDRKVSRSRSVGCGSRSFSGDFFERISTGFGDCTLRRVESQREGKAKVQPSGINNGGNGQDYIKERVKCGGLFSGFMIASSSSSSSSSSYWISSSVEDKQISTNHSSMGNLSHGRSKSWGWAFASPMRAFGKPSSSAGKRDHHNNNNTSSKKNATPNLAAIPSLLAVSG